MALAITGVGTRMGGFTAGAGADLGVSFGLGFGALTALAGRTFLSCRLVIPAPRIAPLWTMLIS